MKKYREGVSFPMAKRCIVFLLLVSISVLAGGCGPKAVYDLEQLNDINAYVKQIVPVIEETAFDFNLWSVDLCNAEKKDWLKMDVDRIEAINRLYTDNFPPYEEIETWIVPVSNGNEEWTIQGEKLAPALEQMETYSKELVSLTNEIVQTDEETFLAGKKEQMSAALEKALEAAGQLGELFYIKKVIDVSFE